MLNLRTLAAASTALALALGVAACSGDSGGEESGAGTTLEVWTADTLPDRVAATNKILDAFTAKTGIKVKLTGVAEDQFNQVLTSSAAAGTLPDVWGSISLTQIRTLSANELVDTEANAEVIKDNDPSTFSERALSLTTENDEQIAIPSDSWAQLLLYRKDLFDKAGLAAPETYEDLLKAAKTLNKPPAMAGFVGANKPGEAFTGQTFEHIALANGCDLVDKDGKVQFGSQECVTALKFYQDLLNNYSVAGNQDVETTRAAYFAGKAAMTVWSTYILDELAGLRNDAKPTCPECASDPAFLAKNTGVVTALQGPDGDEPAQYGQVTSWSILQDGNTDAAKKFMNFMLNEGYSDWTAIAPEGKVPTRKGTPDEPTKFIDAWRTLPAGVDKKAPLGDFYSADVLKALGSGPDEFDRWGIEQGQGDLLGAMAGEAPVAAAVAEVTNGKADPAQAAEKAAKAMTAIQETLK